MQWPEDMYERELGHHQTHLLSLNDSSTNANNRRFEVV